MDLKKTGDKVLDVRDLTTVFKGKTGTLTAVDHLSFSIDRGSCLCLVGESGSGKSATALSILGLIPKDSGRIAGGKIIFDGMNLVDLTESEMMEIRGNRISMIFQDSMNGLNPMLTIGHQIIDVIRIHDRRISRKEARKKAIGILEEVGISMPEERIREYPHQLSGGMKQRVMIALALIAGHNELLIADEPTTALDVTIQAQILSLLRRLKTENDTSILMITHDISVVAETADHVLVLYAGREMESAEVDSLLSHPMHPYTSELLEYAAFPLLDDFTEIEADSCLPLHTSSGCRYASRCRYRKEICIEKEPPLFSIADRRVRCWIYEGREND